MGRRKYLTQRQLAVLDDLFNSDMDEQSVLKKHRLRRGTYERWLGYEVFRGRFKQYVNVLVWRSERLLAKNTCSAADKLTELTGGENTEVARKACLDIMTISKRISEHLETAKVSASGESKEIPQLSGKRASRLLAALAED